MYIHLQKKIEYSINLIRKAEKTALRYQPYGFNVAFSGGKDSQVVYELVKMAGVKHRLIHNFTSMDAPETIRFIREKYPECIIRRPALSFWQLVVKHRCLPTMTMRYCCKELKENTDPGAVTITGVRRQESVRRRDRGEVTILTRRRHPDFVNGSFEEFEQHQAIEVKCLQGLDKMVINPILDWSEDDVYRFLKDKGVELCPLYKTRSRVGCMFCPMSSKKAIIQDVRDYPKHYQAFLKLIHRMREARIQANKKDTLEAYSDEEYFWWWASKLSMEAYQAQLSQPKLPFEDDQINNLDY